MLQTLDMVDQITHRLTEKLLPVMAAGDRKSVV